MVNFLQCDLDQYRETFAKFSDILKTINTMSGNLEITLKKSLFVTVIILTLQTLKGRRIAVVFVANPKTVIIA